MRRAIGTIGLGLLLTAASPAEFGGWTVITVRDLPEYLEVGRPTPLTFTIRQHGQQLLSGRSPTVTVRREGSRWPWQRRRVSASPSPGAGPGVYQVTITAVEAGAVSITIDADFRGSRITLLPVRVIPTGGTRQALGSVDRGRQLFVATGCVTCHMKRDDPAASERNELRVGPELTGRQYPAEWLATKLADPARFRAASNDGMTMPDLGLDDREISALVSYLNQPRSTTALSAER